MQTSDLNPAFQIPKTETVAIESSVQNLFNLTKMEAKIISEVISDYKKL